MSHLLDINGIAIANTGKTELLENLLESVIKFARSSIFIRVLPQNPPQIAYSVIASSLPRGGKFKATLATLTNP